jgi:hypothetical protein
MGSPGLPTLQDFQDLVLIFQEILKVRSPESWQIWITDLLE